jgi:hypothetical protein
MAVAGSTVPRLDSRRKWMRRRHWEGQKLSFHVTCGELEEKFDRNADQVVKLSYVLNKGVGIIRENVKGSNGMYLGTEYYA